MKEKIFKKISIGLCTILCITMIGSCFVYAANPLIYSEPYNTAYAQENYVRVNPSTGALLAYAPYYQTDTFYAFYVEQATGYKPYLKIITTDTLTSGSRRNIWYYSGSSWITTYLNVYIDNNIFYLQLDVTTSINSDYPIYQTLQDGLNNVDNTSPPARSSYSLENGWLSVIDLGSSGAAYDLDLSTTFQMNSGLISGQWGDGTTQRYWFSNTLPDVNSQYVNDGSLILWQKGTPQNVFGQTRNAIVNLSGNSTGRYLYILNPAFQRIADEDGGSITNNPVQISGLLSGQTAYIYELTASATLSGVVNKISTVTVDGVDQIANSGSVTATDDPQNLTDQFVGSDNQSVIQTPAGGNENPVAQNINGILNRIQQTLDQFVDSFLHLLSAPISHIMQLISYGSQFMGVLGQMFTWLPQPVYDVIVAALVLVIVIGVIKLLF